MTEVEFNCMAAKQGAHHILHQIRKNNIKYNIKYNESIF